MRWFLYSLNIDLFKKKKKILVGRIETFMEIKVVYETREVPKQQKWWDVLWFPLDSEGFLNAVRVSSYLPLKYTFVIFWGLYRYTW